jgi:hypothetical protein
MSRHNFTEDGKLDTQHSEKEKIARSKHREQMKREAMWREEYFAGKKSTRLTRLLSASWKQVVAAKIDLFRFKGKNFKEMFS